MYITHTKILGAALVALLALTTASFAQDAGDEASDGQCPEYVRGSRLTASNIAQGVRFKITTNRPANVSSLRQMTRDAATFIEDNEVDGSDAQAPQDPQHPQFPPLDLNVQNIEGGAQVDIKAGNQDDVAPLREQAKELEKLWSTSVCINGQELSGR